MRNDRKCVDTEAVHPSRLVGNCASPDLVYKAEMTTLSLDKLLRQFEIAEANLEKIRNGCEKLHALESADWNDDSGATAEDCVRVIYDIWSALPKIDGWKPDIHIYDATEVHLMRIDAQEAGFLEAIAGVENQISEYLNTIDEYAFRLKQKRRVATRQRIRELVKVADQVVTSLNMKLEKEIEDFTDELGPIHESIEQIDVLLGNSFTRPPRWADLRRHLSFWQLCDVYDIVNQDWPSVYPVLMEKLYFDDEPIESDISDFGAIIVEESHLPISTKLAWDKLSSENFERLIFNLVSNEHGYQDPQWLTHTNAPDRGRDISVQRVFEDMLTGTIRQRVIIQCKHWQSKSISLEEISVLREQMKLWEPPTVDCVVLATSGRFTSDAVVYIEQNNQLGQAPRVEMWPESHLEMLLARKPSLIAEFGLKA